MSGDGRTPRDQVPKRGCPGLTQAFALLRRVTRPSAPSTLRLLDAVIFNTLVGNHDAHGKNFSLLYTQQGASMAASLGPMYDVLSTAVYPHEKMAMKIGSKYRFADVQARHWEQFANDAQLSPAQVKRRILDIARRLPDLTHATEATFAAQGHHNPIIGQIVALISQRCALTIRRLTASVADEP